jgi:hypothetical protein
MDAEKENNKIMKNVVNLFITALELVNSVPIIIKKACAKCTGSLFLFY